MVANSRHTLATYSPCFLNFFLMHSWLYVYGIRFDIRESITCPIVQCIETDQPMSPLANGPVGGNSGSLLAPGKIRIDVGILHV
jgi:hypothetical protein